MIWIHLKKFEVENWFEEVKTGLRHRLYQYGLIFITKCNLSYPKGEQMDAYGAQICNLNLFPLVTLFWSFMMKHHWTTKTFNLTIFPSNSAGKLIFPVEWGTGHRSVDSEHCTEKIKVFKNENWERKKITTSWSHFFYHGKTGNGKKYLCKCKKHLLWKLLTFELLLVMFIS